MLTAMANLPGSKHAPSAPASATASAVAKKKVPDTPPPTKLTGKVKIAVLESDPLRFIGFRALFDSEPDFELVSASLPDISTMQDIELVLLGNRNGQNLFDVMASLKASRPDLRIIVTGAGMDEETV